MIESFASFGALVRLRLHDHFHVRQRGVGLRFVAEQLQQQLFSTLLLRFDFGDLPPLVVQARILFIERNAVCFVLALQSLDLLKQALGI